MKLLAEKINKIFPVHAPGLDLPRIVLFLFLTLSAGLLEGFGMAMFLPLLEFVENGGNVDFLAEGSMLWRILLKGFHFFNVEVKLHWLILLVLFIIIFRIIMVYIRQIYMASLLQKVFHTIRKEVFQKFLHASYSIIDTLRSGYIVNLLTIEAQRVMGYLQGKFQFFANIIVVFVFFVVLILLSVPMTLLAVAILGTAVLIVSYHVRHTKRLSQETTERNQAFSLDLVERLSAFRLIKLTATEARESAHVADASERVRDHNYKLAKLLARVDLFLEPIVVLGGLAILYFSIEVFSLSLAQVGLFMLILLRLLPVSKELLRSRQTYLTTSGSMAAVHKGIESMKKAEEARGGSHPFQGLRRGIRFENVTFTYPEQKSPALEGVDFQIPSGKMTALVGPSGAGKTTLVDVIARLRTPQEGRVLMDGIPLTEYDLGSIRRSIAFVSQEAFIFNDTVKNNLAFARPEATDAEIRGAMDRAMVSEFVAALPQGWNTMLGERGARLSGGQKQRLSLARALLQGAPILVLDEATSALDSEKEIEIQAAIQSLRDKEGMTIVAIAHRLSTIREADIIVVLERGKVQEVGPHERLMHNAEWYSKVSSLQTHSTSVYDD